LGDAIRALALLPRGAAQLYLRGQCDVTGKTFLQRTMTEAGVDEKSVTVLPLDTPDRMVGLAAAYDVGLALEEPISENRLICMRDLCTNKVFTYLLAGLALAATGDTNERTVFGGAGFVYPYCQPEKLAAGLKRWLDAPAALRAARETAWRLGGTQYNWDVEKQKLVAAVKEVLNA
jgi:hypothetical protein